MPQTRSREALDGPVATGESQKDLMATSPGCAVGGVDTRGADNDSYLLTSRLAARNHPHRRDSSSNGETAKNWKTRQMQVLVPTPIPNIESVLPYLLGVPVESRGLLGHKHIGQSPAGPPARLLLNAANTPSGRTRGIEAPFGEPGGRRRDLLGLRHRQWGYGGCP
jgi:hypothetical protein